MPEAVAVAGLNVPVAPLGNPVVPNVTVELNPPAIVSVAVYVAGAPAATVADAGVSVKLKFFTVSVIVLVWTIDPLVAVMVRV